MRRMRNPPTHQQPLLTDPLRRTQRDTHLTRDHPSPLTRQQPRRDHPTLNRTQPKLTTPPNTHQTLQSTRTPILLRPPDESTHPYRGRHATPPATTGQWPMIHPYRGPHAPPSWGGGRWRVIHTGPTGSDVGGGR